MSKRIFKEVAEKRNQSHGLKVNHPSVTTAERSTLLASCSPWVQILALYYQTVDKCCVALCETKIYHDVMLSSKGQERDHILISSEYNESVNFHIYQSFPSRVAGSNKWNSEEQWLPLAASSIHYLTECMIEQWRLGVLFFFFHSIYFEGLVSCSQVKAAKLTKDLEPELVRVELHWSSCVSCVTTNKQKHHTCTTRLKLDPNVKKKKNFMGCLMEATAWDKRTWNLTYQSEIDWGTQARWLLSSGHCFFLHLSWRCGQCGPLPISLTAWMCSGSSAACLSTILWCRKPDGDIFFKEPHAILRFSMHKKIK